MREYKDLFEYLALNHAMIGTSSIEEIIKHDDVMSDTYAVIKALLVDSKIKNSTEELYRIADYRNYFTFDIRKVITETGESVSLAEASGTDSGGQAETSYYVIRTIAAKASFNPSTRNSKNRSISFLLTDESFTRSDTSRPNILVDYLMNDLNFQLITALPTKSGSSLIDKASIIYEVIKEVHESTSEKLKLVIYMLKKEINMKEVSTLKKNDIGKKMKQLELEGVV
jgi:uncharacterized protein YPO0396